MRRILVVLAGCAVVSMVEPGGLSGQQQSTSLAVNANVSKNCTIATSPVNFGAYDPVGANAAAPLDGTGTVTVTCTRGAITHVSLDYGNHAIGTQRRMEQTTTAFLLYQIYKDPGHTAMWGYDVGSNVDLPPAPSITPRVLTAYGRVPQAQDAAVGNYTDIIVATVFF